LSYLIRTIVQPEPEDDDPTTNYTSTIEEEMINRAPHTGPAYIADNRKLWELLYAYLHDTDAYKYIKLSARTTRDGRGAWTSLTNHVLGTASLDNLMATAERTLLRDTFYTGEKRRFDLAKYFGVHKDAHNNLEKAHDQTNGAYPMMDECSKVRHLLDGIHTKSLDAAKAAILNDARIHNDYDSAVDLLHTFVTQGQHGGRGRGGDPAARGHRSGRFGRGGGRGGCAIRDAGADAVAAEAVVGRYYTPPEFKALGPGQRKQVFELREQRDNRYNVAAATTDNATTIAALTLDLNEAQTRNVAAATSIVPEAAAPVANRNNAALALVQRPILRR
jgi:hypothetical protein